MVTILFYLTIVFYLLAWAGSVAFTRLPPVGVTTAAMWNKVLSILCLIVGLLTALCLIAALIGRPIIH